jgi:hypothetical protein
MLIDMHDPWKEESMRVLELDQANIKLAAWWRDEASNSDRTKFLLMMHDQCRLSYGDIAALLNLTYGQVKYAYWKLIRK